MRTRRSGVQGGGATSVVFVTVGTTSFDSLVAAVDDPRFVAAARAKGYTSLVIQARELSATPCGGVSPSRHRSQSDGCLPCASLLHPATQLGRGSYLPTRIVPPGESSGSVDGFSVRCGRAVLLSLRSRPVTLLLLLPF
jgi:hypothetical protein